MPNAIAPIPPRRIDELCKGCGLVRDKMVLNGDPTYVGMNRPLFFAASAVERAFDHPRLQNLRVHMLGVLRKPWTPVAGIDETSRGWRESKCKKPGICRTLLRNPS